MRKAVQTDQIITTSSSFCSSSISLNELVDSLDFEEFLQQKTTSLIFRDPLKSLLEFPQNDVCVKTTPRKLRTEKYVLPEEYEKEKEELPVHVVDCVKAYTKSWKHIKFACRDDVYRDKYERKIDPLSYHHQEYEIDNSISFISSIDESTLVMTGSCASLISSTNTDNTLTPSCRGSWISGFDIEECNLRSVANDPLLPILEKVPIESIDNDNEKNRQKNRLRDIFSQIVEDDDYIERRLPAEIPMEHVGHRFMIKFQQLKFDIEIEPIFCSAAIYDAKEKKKISENFFFDMNTESIKKMLNTHIPYSDTSTQSRSAIFEVTHPSNDLFLVIRLEKILQGDTKEAIEPYLKEFSNVEKAKLNAIDYTERLGKYRAPFCFTAIYLNNIFKGENDEKDRDSIQSTNASSNSLDRKSTNSFDQFKKRASETVTTLSRRGSLERRESQRRSWSPFEDFANSFENFKPISITVSSFFKQEPEKMKDEDLFKFLPELKRPGSTVMKKYKCIPGSIKLEVSPYTEGDVKNALSPELAKISPYSEDEKNMRPIKEILEFPVLPIFNTHYSYRNLLYISPKELNFSTRTGSVRNIAIRIQIMAGEKPTDALNVIYGKSSCPQFQNEIYSLVNYHSKVPSFYDEVKVQLPANLTQNHHILFTIFHISCRSDKGTDSIETPVGWTWIPLLIDGRLNIGEFNLPILLHDPPPSYSFISPDVNLPGLRWCDNHKSLFTVVLDAFSTIYTDDQYLCKFFHLVQCLKNKKIDTHIGTEANFEKELKKAFHDLQSADLNALVKNLQLIMDKLIELLVTSYRIGNHVMSIQSNAFEAICLIADKLFVLQDTQNYGRQSILTTYVQYQCTIPHPTDKLAMPPSEEGEQFEQVRFLHEEIALHWVVANNVASELSLTNSWFLFELIIKSMIEHLDHTHQLNAPRKSRFSRQFTDDIQSLVHMIASKIIGFHFSDKSLACSLNNSLAFFVYDLFSILDRGFVFQLIKNFLKVITTKSSSSSSEVNHYKLDFLRIVCSHEHFIALNLPFGTPFTYNISAPASPTLSIKSGTSQHSGPTHQDKFAFADLTADFRQQHFLIGLILVEISQAFETP